jgi:FolB domain-containing protein
VSTLDILEVQGLDVQCIVGMYPSERDRPQPLIVDLALHLDTRKAGTTEQISRTVDYGRLAGELRFLLESGRFQLLETAAEAIARWVLLPPTPDRPGAEVVRAVVKLTKPEALAGNALAALTITRDHSDVQYAQEKKPFGLVDVVYESKDCGIYRLRIGPGLSIPTHVHRVMDEHELVLGDRLLLQRKPVQWGTAHHWPKNHPHRYDNPSDVEQTLLCVDRPPFIPGDEIEVKEPETLTLPPSVSYAPPGARGR